MYNQKPNHERNLKFKEFLSLLRKEYNHLFFNASLNEIANAISKFKRVHIKRENKHFVYTFIINNEIFELTEVEMDLLVRALFYELQ